MAKKRGKKKKQQAPEPQHEVPHGFWRQVGAVGLVAIAVILVMTWFSAGGAALSVVHDGIYAALGWAFFLLPLLIVYFAVVIFRHEENKLPLVILIAGMLFICLFAGLFGLLGPEQGGVVGRFANGLVGKVFDGGVAAFVYSLLILITLLFVLSISPLVAIKKFFGLFKTKKVRDEEATNAKIAAKLEAKSAGKKPEFKVSGMIEGSEDDGADAASNKDDKKSRSRTDKMDVKFGVEAEGAKEGTEAQAVLNNEPGGGAKVAALTSAEDLNWKLPSLDLLEKKQSPADAGDLTQNAEIIKNTLAEFGIAVDMKGANVGPKVTQYTMRPPSGVKLTRITGLETNIALNLAAQSLRMEAPIPGQQAVGIEVPNVKAADVRIHGILTSQAWKKSDDKLGFAIGKDISGGAVVENLAKMPHILVAGQTGSGKSVMINTMICSFLYRNTPADLRMILVDPKQVEMASYEDIRHLLTPIITTPEKTVSALKWAVSEMERRYTLLAERKSRNIEDYNTRIIEADGQKMPYIVIVIDELADLMMAAARDVEALIVRLAQKARAVGIHLILATQRPSVDVITGLIKANIPARIAFTVASGVDSKTILDQVGAEKLLGKGDMLLMTPSMSKPKRVQGAWVMDSEVTKIADHIRLQGPPDYNKEIVAQEVSISGGKIVDFMSGGGSSDDDQLFRDAVKIVIEARKASTSVLQRKLRIGFSRAARLIDDMENQGIIAPSTGGNRPRDVLINSVDELGGEGGVGDS